MSFNFELSYERNGMKNAITKELKSHHFTINNNFKNHESIKDLNPHWNNN